MERSAACAGNSVAPATEIIAPTMLVSLNATGKKEYAAGVPAAVENQPTNGGVDARRFPAEVQHGASFVEFTRVLTRLVGCRLW